jgi:hypothetical protein
MKKIIVLFLVILAAILAFLPLAYSQTEKAGVQKTLTLPDGEKACDLNGEWDSFIEHYGPWRRFEDISEVIVITQKGSSFSSIRTTGNRYMPEGSEAVRGEIGKDGFRKVQIVSPFGPLDATGQISDDCNRMFVDDGVKVKASYTRK